MNLTLNEFRELIELYRKDLLTKVDLIYQNVIVPMSAIEQAASILEDSTYELREKNYLIKNIYDSFVDPVPISMEEQIILDLLNRNKD